MLDKNDPMMKEFEETGAILHGHFVLSSGLHSDTYIQCAKIFENPSRAMKVCELLANKIRKELSSPIDLILSPAIGGIIVGYEIGRQLRIRTIFCERVNGKFELRRGFEIKKGEKILLIEDVITTGKSSLEAVECAEGKGGKVVAEAALIKRNSEAKLPFPVISLLELNIKNYSEAELPEELRKLPITKPGSREYLSNCASNPIFNVIQVATETEQKNYLTTSVFTSIIVLKLLFIFSLCRLNDKKLNVLGVSCLIFCTMCISCLYKLSRFFT